MAYVRDFLLGHPLPYTVLVIFLAACTIGSMCICIAVAVRSIPDTIRYLRASRNP
jgi:hypothetical protein